MLKRFWGLLVSTLWMTFGSTVRTKPSALQGMPSKWLLGCSSRQSQSWEDMVADGFAKPIANVELVENWVFRYALRLIRR